MTGNLEVSQVRQKSTKIERKHWDKIVTDSFNAIFEDAYVIGRVGAQSPFVWYYGVFSLSLLSLRDSWYFVSCS